MYRIMSINLVDEYGNFWSASHQTTYTTVSRLYDGCYQIKSGILSWRIRFAIFCIFAMSLYNKKIQVHENLWIRRNLPFITGCYYGYTKLLMVLSWLNDDDDAGTNWKKIENCHIWINIISTYNNKYLIYLIQYIDCILLRVWFWYGSYYDWRFFF